MLALGQTSEDLHAIAEALAGLHLARLKAPCSTLDVDALRQPGIDHRVGRYTQPGGCRVLGKTGRADTTTDPAPLSMLESVIVLKPHAQWRKARTWYSSWAPDWMLPVLRHITPDHISQGALSIRGTHEQRLFSGRELGPRRARAVRTFGGAGAERTLHRAVGGDNVSTLIEGRERYPINVRYQRDFRSDLDALGRVLVQSNSNMPVTLSELATIRMVSGPAMLRDEDGLLTGYVFVDVGGRSPGDYVAQARRELHDKLQLPTGYTVLWSGQYESAQRVRERLLLVVPVTLAVVLLLPYFNTRSIVKTAIIILAVPFSAVGALWMVYLLGYNMSIAVWMGVIALLGPAARDRRS